MRTVRITPPADEDIIDILAWSAERFGPSVQERYARLIDAAIRDVADDPERPGSRARPELAQGMRTYHLSFSRQRARGQGSILRKPRHFLVYRLRGDTHIVGSRDEIVAKVERIASLGADRLYLQLMDLQDVDQVEYLGQDVLPQLPR